MAGLLDTERNAAIRTAGRHIPHTATRDRVWAQHLGSRYPGQPPVFGGMLFGEQTDEAEALAIIDRALDAGLNFLDTANIYNRGR
jgi:predicted aldo/keto reductase-like oxidoreductase